MGTKHSKSLRVNGRPPSVGKRGEDVTVDLAIRSTRILTEDGWFDGAVLIEGERIAALTSPDVAIETARLIDVGSRPVLPGMIDTHAHFRDPGYTYKEDFESGTRAAAAGGVTTVFDMPNVDPVTNSAERLRAHLQNAASKSVVDFGHNALGVIPENIASLDRAGAAAFKIWMMTDIGRAYPHGPDTSVSDQATLYRVFEEVKATEKPLFVHPHHQGLYALFVERAQRRWGSDFRSYARALRDGDSVVLDTAIAVLLAFQRSTEARLHVLHVSSVQGFEMIRTAKEAGRSVTCEVNPIALFVTNSWDNVEKVGPFGLGFWVPDHDSEAMWQALVDGTVDVIGSDHGPHTREEKELGWEDMYKAPGGAPFIQHYLTLLLTEVNKGRLTLERVTELCSTNPARLMGIYPRKGRIARGSDADLVVVEMNHREVLRASESLYRCGWMPVEGYEITARPHMTILRGHVIMEDGVVTADAGSGKLVISLSQKGSPSD
jgi:dihydroorotase